MIILLISARSSTLDDHPNWIASITVIHFWNQNIPYFLLSSFYYGELENKYLPHVEPPNGVGDLVSLTGRI